MRAFTDSEPGGHNYENYLQLSKIQDRESSWKGVEPKKVRDSRGVMFLGSEPVTDLSVISKQVAVSGQH